MHTIQEDARAHFTNRSMFTEDAISRRDGIAVTKGGDKECRPALFASIDAVAG